MAQLTLRIADDLADVLRHAAADSGKSLNAWATAVLSAAVDPELAGGEFERLRERLGRAGLLMIPKGGPKKRPSRDKVARARAAAAKGTPLSAIVSEGRR